MKISKLVFTISVFALISSCVKPGEIQDDDKNVNSVTETFQALYKASKGVTPDNLKKN
jgi:hypothetical protein